MTLEPPSDFMESWELVMWAQANLNIDTPMEHFSDSEIKAVMRWIGMNSVDTLWIDGEPKFGRMGIDLMLIVTLLEFPEYYCKFELWQTN